MHEQIEGMTGPHTVYTYICYNNKTSRAHRLFLGGCKSKYLNWRLSLNNYINKLKFSILCLGFLTYHLAELKTIYIARNAADSY